MTGRASSRQPESFRLLCSTQLDSASFCGRSQKGLLGPFMSPKPPSITIFKSSYSFHKADKISLPSWSWHSRQLINAEEEGKEVGGGME